MVKYLVFILEYICACTERMMNMPRRGENIYKRKDGRWEARYIKEITADGKKKYGSVYADNYKDVKAKQQQHLLHPTKIACNSMNITVNVMIAEWLNSIKNRVKPNTYQKYQSVCKNHIIDDFGSMLVKLISNYTIINLTNRLMEKNLSAKSINDILIVLGLVFKYAEEEYEISTPRIRYIKEDKKDFRVLSFDEQLQLITYLNSNVTVLIDGKLVQITETSQFNSTKIEYQFNDSENNQGIATLQLQNDGLKLSITTKVKNSELNIDSIAETFLLSQKSDKPFTEELNAATLLGFIKNKTTVSDLTQKGINIEFVSPLYKDTGSSLYKIKNSDVYLAVYDFDISKTDDFYGNEETSVNDPIIFAVQAPSNIISPSKVGDDCKHFEENGILYAPNFIVGQEYHVLDFIENDTKETTIQKNTIVSCVSESTIGTIHFNELKKQCCENLVSKYYIESSSFEGEPVVSACTVAESQNNYLIYCYEWLSDEQYPIKYYSINKSNYKITFITELDYDEQNDDRETIWESYPEYFGEFI